MRKLIALTAVALAVGGCGGDGEPEANVVEIEGHEYAFVMPDRISGGWTTLRLANKGEEWHEFALFRLEDGKTLADVKKVLSDPKSQQQGPPAWVEIRAGIPTLADDGTAALTQRLDPGRYALVCFLSGPDGKPHFLDGMVREVEVGADAGAEPPDADATVTMGKALTEPELEAGERTIAFRNESDQPNAVFLLSYEPGKTDADLVAWEEGGMKGPAPGEFHGGTIDVPPGETVYYTYTFEEGKEYALVDDANEVERRFVVG